MRCSGKGSIPLYNLSYGERVHGDNVAPPMTIFQEVVIGVATNQQVRFLPFTLKSHGVMVIIMGFGPIDSGSTPDGTIAISAKLVYLNASS